MRITDLIDKKKIGQELNEKELDFIIKGFLDETIADYQMSSFLMAVYFKGMTSKETSILTILMMNSGEVFDLSAIKGIKVDKHSTGGVGDKVSLVVGPIVASMGITMAKMSGRGLGFTGGTLDKLESIPGFKIELTKKQFIDQVNKIGLAIIGQTGDIVPADKKLYALRDVTATVDSIPLIASSIMSKKLATGSDAILLDVKVGDGAFMKTVEEARNLGREMINIGVHLKREVKVEITSMATPLGRAIGNKNEILESIETLKGNGEESFVELIKSAAVEISLMSKVFTDRSKAEKAVDDSISSGSALNKFYEWIEAQGGDVEAIKKDTFWNPKHSKEILADKDGIFIETSAVKFGIAAMQLGAGRVKKIDVIDNEAGIYLNKKTNDKVVKGDLLFTLYSSKEIPTSVIKDLETAFDISNKKIENKTIIEKLS